jgi:hypothetical protein
MLFCSSAVYGRVVATIIASAIISGVGLIVARARVTIVGGRNIIFQRLIRKSSVRVPVNET